MEDDRVQDILSIIITDSTDNSLLQKILTTLWYIWKARNDHRFARKTWNAWQVHHAVVAHTNTAALADSTWDEQINGDRELSGSAAS